MKKLTVYYITGNKRKIERARNICQGTEIKIKQLDRDTPEIQAETSEEVAVQSIKHLSSEIDKPILKLDVSFHVQALNGFPGPFVKYINNWLSAEEVLKMIEDSDDRRCYWLDSLAFSYKNKIKVFTSREKGTIARTSRGENGWTMDTIYIPDGSQKTKAELTNKQRLEICNRDHWDKFIDYVKMKT